MAAEVSGSVRRGGNQLLGSGRSLRKVFSSSVSKAASSLQTRIFKGTSNDAILGRRNSRISTAYQRHLVLLWQFGEGQRFCGVSPIEAGESEEHATAWMAKEGNSVDSETGREYKKEIKKELLWVSAEDIGHLQWKGGFVSV